MAPPTYYEMGRMARDILYKGYHPGLWQLDCRTMSNSGIEFLTSGFSSQDAGKVHGLLQSRYKIEDYGLILTERWNTENLLYGEIMQRDKLAEGLMLALDASFHPRSGDKDGKIKVGYIQEKYNFLSDMTINPHGPLITASIVAAYQQFFGGCLLGLDTGEFAFNSCRLALGWANDLTIVHCELKDGKSWYASLFHKVNDQINTGFELMKGPSNRAIETTEGDEAEERGGGSEIVVGAGINFLLDERALLRGKINTNAEIGLGYEQKLREGITFSVSTVVDGKNISDGNHRFGIGFLLEC